jgi:hypothetical protein
MSTPIVLSGVICLNTLRLHFAHLLLKKSARTTKKKKGLERLADQF